MEASKDFIGRLPSELVRSAHQRFLTRLDSTQEIEEPVGLTVLVNDQTWNLDTIDDFFAELPQAQHYRPDHIAQRRRLIVDHLSSRNSTYVLISLPDRGQIRDFFEFLQAQYAELFEEEKEAAKKVKESAVAGSANVLVFPDLDSGNMCYKLVQYMAGAKAVGPILQGFAKPVNDMSRGASVDDLIGVTAITAIQAGSGV